MITTMLQFSLNYYFFRIWALWDKKLLSGEHVQKFCSPKVWQHLSLLGPILPALMAFWKCHITSPSQNLFPGSLATSVGNYLVSCAAASAWTDRQLPNSAGAGTGMWPGVLNLHDVALHSCLHGKQISSVSIVLTPIHLSVLGLYTPPPFWLFAIVLMWAVCY